MAINYAAKYSSVVDERFSLATVTNIAFNTNYDWIGVKTVNVYSLPTAPLNDYTRSGANRYGVPQELEDSVQEMTLTQDKGFTMTIDRGNDMDQMNVKGAASVLARQIREVITPTVDTYRLGVMSANAGGTAVETPDETNAYKSFLLGQEYMGDNKVPMGGRIAYVTYEFFNFLKLDPSFVKQGDMSQSMVTNGVLGMVDGIPLIPVPSSYLPADANFMIVHPIAAVAPIKLSEYHIHVDPPGISGSLIEGRIYYDAFVLESKTDAIYYSSKS